MLHPAENCQLCPLSNERKHVVWGSGPAQADIMLIGEAPGKNEDDTGLPFVGAAGNTLNSALKFANLSRSEIYITNVVKCRPTDEEGRNRQPDLREIETCHDWLRLELSSVQPKVVLVMGRISSELAFLHSSKHPVGNARTTYIDGRRLVFLATYHPAFIARQRSQIHVLIRDLKRAKELVKLCKQERFGEVG